MSFFNLFKSSSSDSKDNFFLKIKSIFNNNSDFSDYIDTLGDFLIEADVGVDLTDNIIKNLKLYKSESRDIVKENLLKILYNILLPCESNLNLNTVSVPFILLVCGTNGAGKTTTVVKIANMYKNLGKSVCVIAGDTYRPAAIEQLNVLCERYTIPIIKQHYRADSAAVIYDSLVNVKKKKCDIVIIDTSGRLHTNNVLMADLLKIKTTITKLDFAAPHEILLVIDTNIGQTVMSQVEKFNSLIKISGLCLTKFDGSSKCGVIFNLATNFSIPIRYICFGENIQDITNFNAKKFLEKLF